MAPTLPPAPRRRPLLGGLAGKFPFFGGTTQFSVSVMTATASTSTGSRSRIAGTAADRTDRRRPHRRRRPHHPLRIHRTDRNRQPRAFLGRRCPVRLSARGVERDPVRQPHPVGDPGDPPLRDRDQVPPRQRLTPGRLSADNFSARWTTDLEVTQLRPVTFTVTADDGVRVFVDGAPVINIGSTKPTPPTRDRHAYSRHAPRRHRVLRKNWLRHHRPHRHAPGADHPSSGLREE